MIFTKQMDVVGLKVRDLNKSMQWYSKHFGLSTSMTPHGPGVRSLSAHPRAGAISGDLAPWPCSL